LSNYFVQILILDPSVGGGGQRWSRLGEKNSRGGAAAPCPHTSRAYADSNLFVLKIILIYITVVARNFDWWGPEMEKFCDVFLTFFGNIMAITSLK